MDTLPQSAPQRFTGGEAPGKRIIGFATSHHPGTKASIPSRFETILTDNHEANGFGCRTYRFDVSENDLPGPGTYAKFKIGLSTKKETTNYSSQGTSAFASAKKAGFSADAPQVVSPGPGSYSTFVKPQKDPHHGKSSAFSTPVAKRPSAKDIGYSPGPGQYDVQAADGRIPCSAMSSRAPKERPQLPASSSYLGDQHTSTFGRDKRTSASMASKTARFGSGNSQLASTELPPLMLSMAGYSVRSPAPSIVKDVGGSSGPQGGRGASAPAQVASKDGPKASSMFADTILDRFGRPTVRYTIAQPNDIGPGHYEQDAKTKKMLVSSAWALNAVPRDGLTERYKPPGPAYYKVEKPSHHVTHRANIKNTWTF